MYDNAQRKSAEQSVKEGQKALKTGVLKWKPDYEAAAMHFEEATKNFKACKAFDRAVYAHTELYKINEKLMDNWGIARNLDSVIQLVIDNKLENMDINKLIEYANIALINFKASDSLNTGINLMKKFANYLDGKGMVKEACQQLQTALNELNECEVQFQKDELIILYAKLLINGQLYDQAVKLYSDEIVFAKDKPNKVQTNQYGLAIIILNLFQNEAIRAEDNLNQLLNDITGFVQSKEFEIADKMLQYYKAGDAVNFQKLTQQYPLNSLSPVSLTKLALKIKLPQLQLAPQQSQNAPQQSQNQYQNTQLQQQQNVQDNQKLDFITTVNVSDKDSSQVLNAQQNLNQEQKNDFASKFF